MKDKMKMLKLEIAHIKIVERILRKHIPTKEVWAFGSRVKGNIKKFSDLDLAIISEKPLKREILLNLKEDFEESDLPIKVDIVDFMSISKSFQEIIKSNYEIIQKPV